MAAGIIQVNVKWQYLTNIPEDVSINTFHFALTDTSNTADHSAAANRIVQLFTLATAPQVNSLTSYMSDYINATTGNTVTTYNIGDPPPRAPITTTSIAKATALNTANLPFEVAICGSYKAAPISGVPAGRLRNRFYLGPLCTSAGTTTAGQPARPTTVLMADLGRAMARLRAADTAAIRWVVWSGVGGFGSTPAVGWADNEWDTQRRRGQRSTTRTTIAL